MKKLFAHKLLFDDALKFTQWALGGNTLSDSLCKLIDFKKGRFFTLLPRGADLKMLNQFHHAILPQNPIRKYKNVVFQIKPNIMKEVCFYIIDRIKKLQFLIDDFNHDLTKEMLKDRIFSSVGLSYEKEVYYHFSEINDKKSLLFDALLRSHKGWRSVGVLTEANIDAQLTLEKIEEVCQKAKLIVISAYDDEGYIFWEKTEKLNSKKPKTRKTKSIPKKKSRHSLPKSKESRLEAV